MRRQGVATFLLFAASVASFAPLSHALPPVAKPARPAAPSAAPAAPPAPPAPASASASAPARGTATPKTKKLSRADVDRIVRAAVDTSKLPKGASILSVKSAATVEVPEGVEQTSAELVNVPRRAGTVPGFVTLVFRAGGDAVVRVVVPIEVNVPPEALIPDVPKGAPITLVVKKGLVEVSIGGVAAADAEIGGTLPVLLKPSGRVVRARVLDKDHALSIEGT